MQVVRIRECLNYEPPAAPMNSGNIAPNTRMFDQPKKTKVAYPRNSHTPYVRGD